MGTALARGCVFVGALRLFNGCYRDRRLQLIVGYRLGHWRRPLVAPLAAIYALLRCQ